MATGDIVWAAAAIGVLLAQSRPLFMALKWVGATYLLVQAVPLWRERGDASAVHPDWPSQRPILKGVVIDLANPKAAL